MLTSPPESELLETTGENLASDSRRAGRRGMEGMVQILFAALREVIALLQRRALDVPSLRLFTAHARI
jgi:hypothetical protein